MPSQYQKVGLIGKYGENDLGEHLQSIADYLRAREITVYLDQGTADVAQLEGVEVLDRAGLGETCELAIVVGGDGTLLNAARSLTQYDIGLVGINLGRLGFLTDISQDNFSDKLGEILDGHSQLDERLLLQARVVRRGVELSNNIAFNDVVIHKWEEARMLEFETAVDGGFVNSQRSDGLIISTPTGSTAYALSSGGPIMHPSLNAMVLVSICPHTLSQRPLAINADSEVEITISESGHGRAQVTCDGQINLGLMAGDKIHITRYEKTISLVHPKDYNYYEILRAKLHWGEKF